MANEDIRRAARIAGVPLWRIADAVGISQPTMTRWMRHPLTPEKANRIIEAIRKLEKEGQTV